MTRSLYDDRDTVGTIAQEAAQSGERAEVGELATEIMKAFVEDLNDAIASKPYGDRSFYITIHEKKDAQMKNALLRRVLTSDKRPYPEPNTSVFWTDPKTQETRFCWSLPHWSAFPNVLANPKKYGAEEVQDILAYKAEKMERFGFAKAGKTPDGVQKYVPIIGFQDRKLNND